MTETAPEPAPVPETPEGGPLSHLEAAVARHLAPYLRDIRADLADARIKAGNATVAVEKVLPVMARLGSVVQDALKLLDPADAPAAASLLTEAEAIVAEVARIGAAIAATGI